MKPFDLEAAKRGEPIQTREGERMTFIAHVPNATPEQRVLVLDSTGEVCAYHENGGQWADCNSPTDLSMAPKKRTVWLNLYSNEVARMHPTQRAADESGENNRIGGKAWPLEIEE